MFQVCHGARKGGKERGEEVKGKLERRRMGVLKSFITARNNKYRPGLKKKNSDRTYSCLSASGGDKFRTSLKLPPPPFVNKQHYIALTGLRGGGGGPVFDPHYAEKHYSRLIVEAFFCWSPTGSNLN